MCGHHRSRVDGLDEWKSSHFARSSCSQLFDIFGREVVIEKEAFDGLKLEDVGGTGGNAVLHILCSKYHARLTVLLLDASILSHLLALWSQKAVANSTSFAQAWNSEVSFCPSCSTCSMVEDPTLLQGASGKTSSRTRLYTM